MSSLFGESFDLPSFPNPDSFRRNVVPGPIPAPMLITEKVSMSDLHSGDFVLWLSQVVVTVDVSQDGLSMWLIFPAGNRHEVVRGDAKAEKITHITFGSLDSRIPVDELRDDSYRSYGKYENQYSEIVEKWTMDDCRPYDIGSTDENGYHYAGMMFDREVTLWQWSSEIPLYGLRSGNYSDVESTESFTVIGFGNPRGAIVETDDRGFVTVTFYVSHDAFGAAWRSIEKVVGEWYDEYEEDDEESSDDGACSLHGIIECSAPECVGTLLSEVRHTELWAGTE